MKPHEQGAVARLLRLARRHVRCTCSRPGGAHLQVCDLRVLLDIELGLRQGGVGARTGQSTRSGEMGEIRRAIKKQDPEYAVKAEHAAMLEITFREIQRREDDET